MTDQRKDTARADDAAGKEQVGLSPEPKTKEELERKVDEAVEETFPASDPPAFTITGRPSD